MSKTATQTQNTTTKAKQARQSLARVTDQLAELADMKVGQLRERHRELFNEATGSHNMPYLRKKLAHRIQELADGGYSEKHKKRAEELDKTTPGRRRFGKSGPTPKKLKSAVETKDATESKAPAEEPGADEVPADRDPRLPAPGTVLRKKHKNVEHQVKVLAIGFEYKGERYKSLSKVARLITGTTWNGYGYFAAELRAAGGAEA
jgi:hypothetical protein